MFLTGALGGCTHSTLDLELPGNPITSFGDGRDGPLVVTGTLTPMECGPLESTAGSAVTVSLALNEGDRLLLWQVQEEFALVANTADVATPAGAGRWEVAEVVSAAGGVVGLSVVPSYAYASGTAERAQACRIPQYSTVSVPDGTTIAAALWDGVSGGVVAFFATEVDVSGAVSANGAGFRGGEDLVPGGGGRGTVFGDDTSADQGGGKGESLDPRPYGMYGRGNYGNGGGGGNSHNAGGGGGGGGGMGGFGGKEGSGTGDEDGTRGLPGAAIVGAGLLVPGGGGGSGEVHHDTGVPGGSGGGVVLVGAETFTGDGAFRADGESVAASSDDGVGGGGGGGTIVLLGGGAGFGGSFSARGGDGGDFTGTSSLRGGGGGGGGGRVSGAPAASATIDVGGGEGGVNTGFGDDPWGATSGEDGLVETP